MVTNQVMKRPMGKFMVEQRTKDSMSKAKYSFHSLKKEFKEKKVWDIESLLDFKYKLMDCEFDYKELYAWCELMDWLENEYFKCSIFANFPQDREAKSALQKVKSECIKTYIMVDHNTGLYKIGKSKNPVFRESTLQSIKPTVELVMVFECDVEKEIHEKFSDIRVRGEWFALSPADIEYLRKKYTEKYLPSVLQNKK